MAVLKCGSIRRAANNSMSTATNRDDGGIYRPWQSLPQAQRKNIEAAAMDMSADFAAATAQEAPQVVIVHDKFHVAKMLNEAVDRVRRREHKELLKQNDQRLTGSRQLWLYNPINLKDERAEEFERDTGGQKHGYGADSYGWN